MKMCLYCSGKLEIIKKGVGAGQPRCVECKAIFNINKTKKKDLNKVAKNENNKTNNKSNTKV